MRDSGVSSVGSTATEIFDLRGSVALVTGASSGLGRRFAQVLVANGAAVAVAGRRADALDRLVNDIQAAGGRAVALSFDITASDQISPAFELIEETLGTISILVNNAGIAGPGTVAATGLVEWRKLMTVNLEAQFLLAREGAARMSQGGAIINVSSILGLAASKGDVAYSVAKAGLIQLSNVMALEFAPLGIRVNTVAPGYVVTGMNEDFFASSESGRITERIPLGRVGQVDDLDGAILLLASRASRFMTGSTVVVDGGHMHVL